MIAVAGTIGIIVPSNIWVYATSDASYVETVSSTIDVGSVTVDESLETQEEYNNNTENMVVKDIAEVLGMDTSEELTYSLIFGEELAKYDVVLVSKESEKDLEERFDNLSEITDIDLNEVNPVDIDKEDNENSIEGNENSIENNENNTEELTENIETQSKSVIEKTGIQADALIAIDEPDESYAGTVISLTEEDRYILEHLVMGEAGGEGMEGAALVAQAIRDTMVYKGFSSVEDIRKALKYSGSLNKEPNQATLDAVHYIFDEGGCAVKHPVFYFYAPKSVDSCWHETQHFVVQHKGHRFFSNNK